MAKILSVWGIEIGQSALKALRCRMDGEQVLAEAFDYVEYPKILSQPEASPETLIKEAILTFLSRNDLKNCKVGITVPGQSGLAKFFKPPPVEVKRIPDIVKYEAKQQIPFDLNDVIWDFQQMAGGMIEQGFALDTEVGLFAMKREAVYRYLKPFTDIGIEVDLIQLNPLAVYNMITHDRLPPLDEEEPYDADRPPKSTVVLAMGTDATDLIVTNGYRVWQRSMPLGGNHFTRQLTKDLKLTFAKAEHLKRNAMEADDPKLVFQAMRPVFNDLVTEVQRSLGFFRSLNKKADLGSIVMLGNTVKLTGLPQFLSKNLGMEVEIVDAFQKLAGPDVLSAPAFKENIASFVPVYGLCLQQLHQGPVLTSLVPPEILKQRRIRAKKPWVVLACSVLLLGMVFNLVFANGRYVNVRETKWKDAVASAEETKSGSSTEKSTDDAKKNALTVLTSLGNEVAGNKDRRVLWVELLYSLGQAVDRSQVLPTGQLPPPTVLPYQELKTIYLKKIESKYYEDLTMWYTPTIAKEYEADRRSRLDFLGLKDDRETAATADPAADPTATGDGAAPADAAPAEPPADAAATADAGTAADGSGEFLAGEEGGVTGPSPQGKGWVIEIEGYHFHNSAPDEDPDHPDKYRHYRQDGDELEDYVLKTLVHKLETGTVLLPLLSKEQQTIAAKIPPELKPGELRTEVEFTYAELGISFPFIVKFTSTPNYYMPNPDYLRATGQIESYLGSSMAMGMGGMGGMDGGMGMGGMPGMDAGMGGMPGMGGGMPGMGGATPGMGGGMPGMGGAMPGMGGMPGSDAGMSGAGMGIVGGAMGMAGPLVGIDGKPIPEDMPKGWNAPRCDFVLQMVWQEKPLTNRVKKKADPNFQEETTEPATDSGTETTTTDAAVAAVIP